MVRNGIQHKLLVIILVFSKHTRKNKYAKIYSILDLKGKYVVFLQNKFYMYNSFGRDIPVNIERYDFPYLEKKA